MRILLPAAACLFVLLSGCTGPAETITTTTPPVEVTVEPMTFLTHVLPAVHQGHGLYEPTIDVSPEGTIYVSSHSTGIGVHPAPGYYSVDDGATWSTLALAGPAATPAGQQGSAPLFSDEIFIVAGDDGTAWGVDINLRDYIVTGWCGDGAELCYYNPNAYDHAQVGLQASECQPIPLKDRPWAAYANGTLLLVNNPGGGPAQVGSMRVPPAVPGEVGTVASDIQWNLCASSGGFIPGIPDLRPDGFFAVPQVQGGAMAVITGNAADVMAVEERKAFNHSYKAAPGSQVGDFGQAVFDGTGALFVAGMENKGQGGSVQVAVSLDDGKTFASALFTRENPVSAFYMDGNRWGSGALLNWGEVTGNGTDWYFGHVSVVDGKPALGNVFLAVDDGPAASRHVQGAALGPDGRAYMVMSEVSGNDDAEMVQQAGTTPLSVVVQDAGVRMDVGAAAPEA